MWGAALGRDACADRLEAVLAAGKAALSVAVIEGAAGMGKTTLVSRTVEGFQDRHIRRAGGRVLQQRVPFGVLDDLLDGWVSHAFDARVDDPLTWTLRGADLLVDQVTTATTNSPVVLVVDDLQWADPVSVVALDRALHRLANEPVTILLALRPEGRTTKEVQSLVDFVDATFVRLGPLTDGEATALVRDLARDRSQEEIETIVRNGAGNPLYLRHLAEAEPSDVSLGPVVAAHVAELPEDVAPILRVAAVGGTSIDVPILEAITQRNIGKTLDVIAASGLVVPEGAGWRFEHDLVRDAVLESVTESEQDGIRRAFAAALAQRTDTRSLAEGAAHLLAAGPPFTDAEANLLARAARDAVHTDPDNAEELFGVLIDALPPTDPRYTTALAGLRDAQRWTRGHAVHQDTDSVMRRLEELNADDALTSQDIYDAEHIVRQQLEGDEMYEALSQIASIASRPRIVDELTEREASLSELGRIRLGSARARLAFRAGAFVQAAELARRTMDLMVDLPETNQMRIDATSMAGRYLCILAESRVEGFELLATAARAAERAGLPRHQLAVACYFGDARYFWAEWDDACALFSTAMSIARDVGRQWGVYARRMLLRIAVQQGERDAVERLIPSVGEWEPWIRVEVARDSQLAGDHDQAMRILGTIVVDGEDPSLRGVALMLYSVSAHLADDERRREFVRSAARSLVGEGIQVRESRKAALALVNLDPHSAWEGKGPSVPLADVAEHIGLVSRARGDAGAAIEHFTVARDVWAKCGADARLARIDAWLRELGVHTRGRIDPQRPRTGWDAVTDAEMRVATLVGEGLTYQDIADRLFLSRRTVESHVASILRKLGLRNRGELAASYLRRHSGSSHSSMTIP